MELTTEDPEIHRGYEYLTLRCSLRVLCGELDFPYTQLKSAIDASPKSIFAASNFYELEPGRSDK